MFPGGCARCGGPQWWRFDDEDSTWVKCMDGECSGEQLPLPGLEDEPDFPHEWPQYLQAYARGEPEVKIRVEPSEGGAGRTSYN